MSSSLSLKSALSILAVVTISYVNAISETPGGPCSVVGETCTWASSTINNVPTTFTGACAPDLFCGDNGAACTTDDNCFNFCGTGICGGLGAECTSTEPFFHGQAQVSCNSPAFICDTDNENLNNPGTCVSTSTGGSSKTRHRRQEQRNMKRALQQCDGPTESLCGLSNGNEGFSAWECIDTHSNLERCGGCVTDGVGQDCTLIPGAVDIECLVGTCTISSCLTGYALQDGTCVEI